MSKAILVMDMPEHCEECPFLDDTDYTCGAFEILGESYKYVVPDEGKLEECPLCKMPKRGEHEKLSLSPMLKEYYSEYKKGWNACLDAITGEVQQWRD